MPVLSAETHGMRTNLLQETYKRALAARRKPEVASADEIRPWVFTIMRHIWQNERRRVVTFPGDAV